MTISFRHDTSKSLPGRSPALRLGLAVFATSIASGVAWGQSAAPNQIEPGVDAVQPSPDATLSLPLSTGLTPPEGSADIEINLAGIDVDGGLPALEIETRRLSESFETGPTSVADVYGFAADLQAAYTAAGYPLARVIVPSQNLEDGGSVRIVVIDGFIEGVDATGLPSPVRKQVEGMLASIVRTPFLRRAQIERQLLLAGDTAGLSLSSVLAPGTEIGGTILVLSGDYQAVSAAVAVDNRVGPEFGRMQLTGAASSNSVMGHGERLSIIFAGRPTASMFEEEAVRRYIAVSSELPIGTHGLSVALSGDYSTTYPGGAAGAQELFSEYGRIGAEVRYPVLRSRSSNLIATVGVDVVSDVQKTAFAGPDTTLSADRLRILRLGLSGDTDTALRGRANFALGVSRGFDAFGARSRDSASPTKQLSRIGADADLLTMDAAFGWKAPLSSGAGVAVMSQAQYSFNEALVRSEQFSASSNRALSGPTPGLLVGDGGVVVRTEIDRPTLVGSGQSLFDPFAFVASSKTWLEAPSALESDNTDTSSLGLGLRMGFLPHDDGGFHLSGAIEYSRANSDNSRADRDWLNVSMVYRY